MMYLGACLIILVASAGVSQTSQPPSPAPAKSSHQPEANAAQHNEAPAKDQRGTESLPLFIKVIPSQIVEPQPATETQSQNDYASPEWALVYATIVLVAFTAGLMCYTARLWRETKNLARDARKTATQQAETTQASLLIAQESAAAAKSSVELARQDFLSTHRPKIILRDAFCNDNEIGNSIVVTYTLANIGETRAHIVLWGAEVQVNTGGNFYPDRSPSARDAWDDGFGGQFLESGEERQAKQYTSRLWSIEDQSRHAFDEELLGVFFCGHLVYEDERMVRRHMAFWRKYDLNTSRFYLVHHPILKALEYAD